MDKVDKILERTKTKYSVKIYINCVHCQGVGTRLFRNQRIKCLHCNGKGHHPHFIDLRTWVAMIAEIKSELIAEGVI